MVAGVALILVLAGSTTVVSGDASRTTQRLVLPADLPEHFEIDVRLDGIFHTLVLERHSLRAGGFRVRAYLNDGRTVDVAPPVPATYRGSIAGETGTSVIADLGQEGLNARLVSDGGPTWTIRALPGEDRSSGAALHEVRAGYDPPTCDGNADGPSTWCGNVEGPSSFGFAPEPATVPTGGTVQHLAEIAFDLTFPFYEANGSTIPGTVAAAEAQLNVVDFLYAGHVLITYTITDIIVRTAPFYPPGLIDLNVFIDEWNANHADIPRDMAHLLTDVGSPFGVAAVGVVCDLEEAYGWSAGPPEVLAHELGHNWSSFHCHDYVPCNITCSNCLDFGPKLKKRVVDFRDSIGCLDPVGPHPDPLPPAPELDVADITRDEIAAGGATRTLDVLSNDLDGNLDPLSIDAFDAASVKGGTVMLSAGTGAGGNDELIYTAPSAVFPGSDRFTYTLGDTTGEQTVGDVALRVDSPGLVGYWKLDGDAADASGGERHGTIEGATFTPGVYGQALQFDGFDDDVVIPGLNRDMPSMTITTWLRRDGNQVPFAGIVVSRRANGVSSLNFGNANELRYQWADDDPAASGWDSGLVVPALQWVFAALVVEPQKATIYLHDGMALQSAENLIVHRAQDFASFIYLGWEPFDFSRRLGGALDDVRIYDYALTSSEITALHDLGGRAHAPSPPDGGGAPPGSRELAWSPGLEALSHDVYFGIDFAAVRDATQASPEFRGNTTGTDFVAPPPLFEGGTYFWRIDEVTAGGVVAGHVHVFSVNSPLARWSLDETSGTTAADVAGGFDGTYLGGPLLDQPPAQPELDRSVSFDGVDDAVEIPPLNFDANELTFTVWVLRDGQQTDNAAILFTRSAATIAGLNLGPTGNLRYKWRDNGGVFGTGFIGTTLNVPDAVWTLVAMVISPEQTRIHLGAQGELSTFITHFPNTREEFDGPLYLGRDPGLGTHFKGQLDDVRIYPFAMDPAQVATLFAAGQAAGHVPDGADVPGAQLMVDKLSGGEVSLSWSPPCIPVDGDYAVYEGGVGDFTSHLPTTCSTGGATTALLTPQTGDRYFLVVPKSNNREGGYGADGSGQPRPPSSAACRVQFTMSCN